MCFTLSYLTLLEKWEIVTAFVPSLRYRKDKMRYICKRGLKVFDRADINVK